MKCNNCGAEVAEGMNFCNTCGTPVSKEFYDGDDEEYDKRGKK